MNPKEGFLSGTILKVSGDRIQLLDFDNKEWNIDYNDAFISHRALLQKGEQIKLIGEITGNNNFKVKEIRPWKGYGRNQNRKNWGRGK